MDSSNIFKILLSTKKFRREETKQYNTLFTFMSATFLILNNFCLKKIDASLYFDNIIDLVLMLYLLKEQYWYPGGG